LLALTTMSFDISVLELFLPLTTGGRVVIAPSGIAEEPQVVAELISRHSVTMIQGTPSTFRLLLATGWEPDASLTILCGGEPVTADLAAQLKQHGSELWNVYGPTETTVWSTVHRIDESAGIISIGHPIENTRLKVLDHQRRLVPIGVPGELWIGGEGVAAGYWNRPELTIERFVDFSTEPSGPSIYYRTGDLVCWQGDGSLQFLSRADRQVKVRGHRVELGDVEVALQRHPAVAEAAVVKIEQASGASLIAFCSLKPSGTTDTQQGRAGGATTDASPIGSLAAELREYLRGELPEYMVPSRMTILEQLPHTPAGKLDYRTLPITELTIDDTQFVAPRTPLEYQIAEVWRQVLQRESIGIHDNFFDLGGHSLMAAQVFARLRDQFQLEMPLRELYRRPTVAEIAEWVVSQQMEAAGDDEVARLLAEVEQMSDAEALKALDQTMEPME
jgi:acyl-coenzyme A synthetase/AMP-(fatty) acid ligase/acyl carrier protein